MGRSRAVPHTTDEDPSHSRSKRKRTASNVENLEPASTGSGMSEGKKALYHCNYCNKDISGKIRIKCAACPDFDLCVECFSVGAEVTPHKNSHTYRVMDNLSFPLICPDWNADDEILLLEGIEMYGLGNWVEIAEHVGTKSKSLCIDHYNAIYMKSPCFPLPDMSHVIGKNREELLAMAKEQGDVKNGFPTLGEVTMKEEIPLSMRIKGEDQRKDVRLNSEMEAGSGVGNLSSIDATKRTSQAKDVHENIKKEDRGIVEKKPRISAEEALVPMTEQSGYNSKRQEFEIEYDNEAEQLLADMEFKETDSDAEREIKLRVLRIYSKRLDERKRRKDFIIQRNLLCVDPLYKSLSPEEREICNRYKVFMRFHTKEEHEMLLKTVIEEHRILRRIKDLQEARAAGCRTSSEAERYIEQKMRKESEEIAVRSRDGIQIGLSGQAISGSLNIWDVSGFAGANLLSESEKRLCGEIRILPTHYLNMQQVMSIGVMKGEITKKSDAYVLFKDKVEPGKVDRVYDMLVKKGLAQP
ncbi:transcriptional adapter ADA2-like [Impatiens glandulifera]|uniref:transcriptional adapter ADA2-like n=1 Tax=Impatiens glandulifera TaxID=253017 RepID=UPI001FB102E5|nr:transcriptional adapter ADA2-like [Impatiens glandulifera]